MGNIGNEKRYTLRIQSHNSTYLFCFLLRFPNLKIQIENSCSLLSASTREQQPQHQEGAGKTIYHSSADNYFEAHSDSMDKRQRDRG